MDTEGYLYESVIQNIALFKEKILRWEQRLCWGSHLDELQQVFKRVTKERAC